MRNTVKIICSKANICAIQRTQMDLFYFIAYLRKFIFFIQSQKICKMSINIFYT